MFFHPEFLDARYSEPIDSIIDKAIQSSPIDYRRKLYGVYILLINECFNLKNRISSYLVDQHYLKDLLLD